MDPNALKYAKTHEWISIDDDIATIGISAFAVRQLTDLVYIDLPAVGRKLTPGEVFGEVESVKAVSDLYAPVAGEVVAVNESLADDLSVLSSDPFNKGWMIRLKLDNPDGVTGLLNQEAYEAHCAAESH